MDTMLDRWLETADAIGSRLCRDALRDGKRCNWLGSSMEFIEGRWQVVQRTFGPDMYAGTTGIAFFLAHLFRKTGNQIHRAIAEAALRQALSRIDSLSPNTHFGFYSGLTGIAYVLLQTFEVLDREEFRDIALHILRRIEPEETQSCDIVSGSAGVIPALLHVHTQWPQDFLLRSALQHGSILLKKAEPSEEGWSWNTIGTAGQKNLTGFSHGAAGIGWALLELYAAFGDQKFLTAAQSAFSYERHWFDRRQSNWPDFRSFGNPQSNGAPEAGFTVAWCHGAPGIGLSRIRAFQLLAGAEFLEEIKSAVASTSIAIKQAIQLQNGNYSLCHGVAGNADLLIEAHKIGQVGDDIDLVNEAAQFGINRYLNEQCPWPCGVLGGGETPSLMLGLAGIGYFYLRLGNRDQCSSILMITPPSNRKAAVA